MLITRHVKEREEQGQLSGFSSECTHFFHDGSSRNLIIIVETKLLSYFESKQENDFIWVKLVIILNFYNKKLIFIVFYVKDVN